MFSNKTEGILIKYAKNQSINTITKIIDVTIRNIMQKNEFVEPRFLNVFIHEKDSFDFFYPIVDGSVIFLP
jgi:hypothetical protein